MTVFPMAVQSRNHLSVVLSHKHQNTGQPCPTGQSIRRIKPDTDGLKGCDIRAAEHIFISIGQIIN